MAKSTILSALLTALGSFSLLASAQIYNTSDPFILQLSSDNATITDQVLAACHAGAAIEELCLAGTDTTPDTSTTFYLNVSASAIVGEDQYETGLLVWTLHGSGFNLSEALSFSPPLDSNVVSPELLPSDSGTSVGFDDDEKLFILSSYYDESTFVDGQFPTQITPVPLYHVSS